VIINIIFREFIIVLLPSKYPILNAVHNQYKANYRFPRYSKVLQTDKKNNIPSKCHLALLFTLVSRNPLILHLKAYCCLDLLLIPKIWAFISFKIWQFFASLKSVLCTISMHKCRMGMWIAIQSKDRLLCHGMCCEIMKFEHQVIKVTKNLSKG